MNLESPPTLKTQENGFNRGAVFFLPPGFPGADIIISVHIPDVDRVSFCAIQVTNRKYDRLTASPKSRAKIGLKSTVNELKWSHEHVSVIMRLRYKLSSMGSNSSHSILLPETPAGPVQWLRNDSVQVAEECEKTRDLAMGMDESVYPSVNLCRGERTPESNQILTLLTRLLDCIPRFAYPDDADQHYLRRTMPLG